MESVLFEEDTILVDRNDVLPSTPPLLQTCKQIRAEAGSIFYGGNKLSIYIRNFTSPMSSAG
jgi:hypothetical protein